MKKVEAIIRVSKLEGVKDALTSLGVPGMTVTEAHGTGAEKGQTIVYRGNVAAHDFVPRVKLETVVPADDVEAVIDAIYQHAYTGKVGDGRILVIDLEDVIRIRTGESETAAIHVVAH